MSYCNIFDFHLYADSCVLRYPFVRNSDVKYFCGYWIVSITTNSHNVEISHCSTSINTDLFGKTFDSQLLNSDRILLILVAQCCVEVFHQGNWFIGDPVRLWREINHSIVRVVDVGPRLDAGLFAPLLQFAKIAFEVASACFVDGYHVVVVDKRHQQCCLFSHTVLQWSSKKADAAHRVVVDRQRSRRLICCAMLYCLDAWAWSTWKHKLRHVRMRELLEWGDWVRADQPAFSDRSEYATEWTSRDDPLWHWYRG